MRLGLFGWALVFLAGCSGTSDEPGGDGSGTGGEVREGQESDRPCGVRGVAPCGGDEFCSFPREAECGAADRPGTCALRPEICTEEYRPVCGCDGRTYGNECDAHRAGTSAASDGECEGSTEPGASGGCVRGGCSGQLCVEEGNDAISTCEWRDEYACYQQAACERQGDGQCGFTPTAELEACLSQAR